MDFQPKQEHVFVKIKLINDKVQNKDTEIQLLKERFKFETLEKMKLMKNWRKKIKYKELEKTIGKLKVESYELLEENIIYERGDLEEEVSVFV
ncbi:uncharacterized protein G2W53_007341 [Senna tora]|uniref:Uncharacterized protein n=1 Tax=Senna tora TaxID=362788 RepID=A0A835CE47_9FABA|nr:uncharacterized protein G2W53_007341 [Senna tora]